MVRLRVFLIKTLGSEGWFEVPRKAEEGFAVGKDEVAVRLEGLFDIPNYFFLKVGLPVLEVVSKKDHIIGFCWGG